MLVLWVIAFSILGSVGVILLVGMFLLFPEAIQDILVPCLISYATGTLLAASLLGLIPHALEHSEPSLILSTVLAGIIMFFLLEKLIIWRHCHDAECEVHSAAGPMIIIGDAFHNFIDGAIIAASFLSSITMGIAASLSVIIHEIAQEVGDFGILLHSGYTKKQALFWNLLSSIATLPASVLAFYTLKIIRAAIPYVMGISAASFLYIALADLSPELHRKVETKYAIRQFVLLLAGIATMAIFLRFHP